VSLLETLLWAGILIVSGFSTLRQAGGKTQDALGWPIPLFLATHSAAGSSTMSPIWMWRIPCATFI